MAENASPYCELMLCSEDEDSMAEVWCGCHDGFFYAAPTLEQCLAEVAKHRALVRETHGIERATQHEYEGE